MKRCLALGRVLSVLLIASCSTRALKSGDVSVSVDDGMCLKVATSLTQTPLLGSETPFSRLALEGGNPAFALVRTQSKAVRDAFGKGTARVFLAEAPVGKGKILERLTLISYDRFPSAIIARAEFVNATGEPQRVTGWEMNRFDVLTADPDPFFWSFQGQSTEARADWILPVRDAFFQQNAEQEDAFFLMFAHGYEFDFGTKESNWDKFRRICETVASHDDVIACSIGEAFRRHEEG